jgi:hypothetical protein
VLVVLVGMITVVVVVLVDIYLDLNMYRWGHMQS